GVRPWRLRGVNAAAAREADMINDVVAPLRRQENPCARSAAEETARQLAALSAQLHAALVQTALRLRS
ncbi:MAG TPA: MerR family transcriptional regulator, partial [Streptomyces sp.]|nr:MerR family transcriptional regulator [Streptomyces sp.]